MSAKAASNGPDEIGDWLAEALARESGGAPPRRVETHISRLFLGPQTVYKLKKPMRLPYLDFSTPELRLAACAAELRLNRRTAPALYRRVRRITREASGLVFDGEGPLVDAVVEMTRFDDDLLFDRLASEGRLTPALLQDLAGRIAAFHVAAEPAPGCDAGASIDAALAANAASFRAQPVLPGAMVEPLLEAFARRRADLAPLLARRAARVRRCHGDLHLGNICLVDGVPTLFDCIEFSDDLATIDVLYDLAFLLMDLWRRGLTGEANLVLNRYLDASGDEAELGLLPFYMAVRAAVRAHVSATQADGARGPDREELRVRAEDHARLAGDLLAARPARLVAVGGLSGSGKSTVAAGLAPGIGAPPGARVLSTDRLRKALFGRAPTDRLPAEAYAPEVSARVYDAQRDRAARVLAGGGSLVADGVFLKLEERAAIERVARVAGVAFSGLWLDAPQAVLQARVEARRHDPSDATVEVVAMQAQRDPGAMDWTRVPAGGSPAEALAQARAVLAP